MVDTNLRTGSVPHHREAVAYVKSLLNGWCGASPGGRAAPDDASATAEAVFRLLTSREWCYLSRQRVVPYHAQATAHVEKDIRAGRPLRFYYDIGGGYHASRDPWSEAELCFDVGLGELCILAQIESFHRAVLEHYAPGVEFHLVIDNLCALLVNDIPLDATTRYVARLRTLVEKRAPRARVKLLVESEHFSPSDYELPPLAPLMERLRPTVNASVIENVARFLGRPCGMEEALERLARYRAVTGVSEEHLESLIDGVHMTQRATPTTLCFRPFEGGDARIQTGEVALTTSNSGGVRPVLLTSRNRFDYRCHTLRLPEILPEPIEHVTFAERVSRDTIAS